MSLSLADIEAIADAIWQETAPVLLLAIARNRNTVSQATGTMTVYADDDITVLAVADVFEDASGLQPYQGQGAERRERLT